MVAPSCSECGGTPWVRYLSEMMDGGFEEAFRLCPCNYEPGKKTRGEGAFEKPNRRARTVGGETSPLLSRDNQNPV